MQKRILTIQDYSCLGRCSLTVALPTISAYGIECVGIPTAVLSNHTQFESWTFSDLTNDLNPIVKKWEKYNNHFDTIYTGYLSTNQVDIVKDIIKGLKKDNTLVFIDPAMADNGKLYPGFASNHVTKMKELCLLGDIVKPNVTEACLLADIDYPTEDKPLSFYLELCNKLVTSGMKCIILTGIKCQDNKLGILTYSKDKYDFVSYDYVNTSLHGTGDLFSSALASGLTLGFDLNKSIDVAHKYVVKAIEATQRDGLDGILYGPEFEKAIPYLVGLLAK